MATRFERRRKGESVLNEVINMVRVGSGALGPLQVENMPAFSAVATTREKQACWYPKNRRRKNPNAVLSKGTTRSSSDKQGALNTNKFPTENALHYSKKRRARAAFSQRFTANQADYCLQRAARAHTPLAGRVRVHVPQVPSSQRSRVPPDAAFCSMRGAAR